LLVRAGADVRVVMTASAERFVGSDTFAALTGHAVHTSLWDRTGEILHISLAHDVDAAIVAPATANILAKLATGIADDLLTSTLLEFSGPVVVAPAMHTGMWEHPATRGNVATLVARGVRTVGPATGSLAHGDTGLGRMAEPEEIVIALEEAIARRGDLTGRVVVVTAGPTHEAIDPVRFIGNRSSGKMGVAIAADASRRGADVRLILGPGAVAPPPGVATELVVTAEEMRVAVLREAAGADVVVMAAAVADFRPKAVSEQKLKKDQGPPELLLEPTPDILAELGEARDQRPVLVGFAAETADVEQAGRRKLALKGVDLLVANRVGRDGTGFGSEANEAIVLDPAGVVESMRTWTKPELAAAILDRVVAILAERGTHPGR
jgi:phosphopantothenoylcysteine decarboxylase/phosphopantothenate--cysteine ligase